MILRFFLGLVAALLFLGAAMLSSAPALPPTAPPDARDVAAARALVLKSFWAVKQNRTVPLGIQRGEMAAAPRLLAHGTAGLRADGGILPGGMAFRASYPLAARTWVNVGAVLAPHSPGSSPDIRIRIGSVSFPAWLTRGFVDLAIAMVWDRSGPPPTTASLLRQMSLHDSAALLRVDVPVNLLGAIRGLADGGSADTAKAARATWAKLIRVEHAPWRPTPLETLYARAFEEPTVSTAQAKGKTLGTVISIWNVSAIRWVDKSVVTMPQERMHRISVRLADRRDLALHFAISAALAANGEAGLTSAIGEWKELDDSLPGGSGFSFVDLAADRAGTRLGEALADPARTRAVQTRLAKAKPGDLLPLEALGLDEGLSEAEFEARFGRLDSDQYQAAVARIDAALDRLPLYAP